MSKYQCFKEWIKTKAPTSLASFDSVVRQDSSVVQMTADFVDGVLTTKAASDAIIAIAYADHCTQSLQAEIEKLKAENERLSKKMLAYRSVIAWHSASMAAACVAMRNQDYDDAMEWLVEVLNTGELPWEAHTDPQVVFDRYNYHSTTEAEQVANVERFNRNMAEDWAILEQTK